MIRDTPNFTYVQDLACRSCGGMAKKMYAQDMKGRYKRLINTLKRPEKKGAWAADDVLEEDTVSTGKYTRRATGKRVWVHRVSLMCSRCGCAGSPANFVRHDFADDELPFDFWDKPDGVYLPEEPPSDPASSASDDPYPDLADLF